MARKPQQVRLQFKQPLTAKGLSNAELQKRLKALHQELAELDQEQIDTSSLDKVAKDCISHSLLLHKEKGVKAYLACCLVDILRLYAPEAPYTQAELRDLFQFLFRQLKYLTTSQEPHFTEYFYLIESLSNVKSIVLICDLDSGDELMADLFRQSFDVISSSSPKNVQLCVADALSQVIDEAQTLSNDVVDIIVAQFLPATVKKRPASHQLAVEVCSSAADKLQRYICQYFAEVITSTLSGKADSEDEESESDDDAKAKKAKKGDLPSLPSKFVTAHALIRQINLTVPSLLLNVIPQLEEELTAEKPEYRKIAAETLGQMIAETQLAVKYPNTWREFLKRGKDRIVPVRVTFTECLGKIWTEQATLAADVEAVMGLLFKDPEERVRTAACVVFEGLDFETASNHASKTILVALAERCKDRKPSVRNVAFKALGKLYSLAYSEIEAKDERAVEHFAWIPAAILRCLVVADSSVQCMASDTFFDYFTPLPSKDDDESQWVDRLLTVVGNLAAAEQDAFLNGLTRLPDTRPGPFDAFIMSCERNNGGVIDKDAEKVKERLKTSIQGLSMTSRFPDSARAMEDLQKFAKANEKMLYKHMRTLLDPQADLKTILKTYKDTLKRLEAISPSIVDTFVHFIRGSAYLIVNRSSVSTLLKRVQTGRSDAAAALKILTKIAKLRPVLFRVHIAELTKALSDGSPTSLVTIALQALSALVRSVPEVVIDKKLAERAKTLAVDGNVKQAKYAATIVALDRSRERAAEELVESLTESLNTDDDAQIVPHLAALNRLGRFAETAFETQSEQITAAVLNILSRAASPGELCDDEDIHWVEDAEVDDLTAARILAVKILTSRCLAYANDKDSATQVAEPVFALLWPLLLFSNRFPAPVASRLRLTAALSILKLATFDALQAQVVQHLPELARITQDTCFEVRHAFVLRLLQYLRADKLKAAPRFNMALFLTAHDPEDELRQEVAGFVRRRSQHGPLALRQALWEHPFVRLIHLLSRHPDFAGEEHEPEEIETMSKYIAMYIDTVVNENNLPYIYHLAQRLKTVADREDSAYNNNLYILSDLAQHLLNQTASLHGWSRPTHPEMAKMPGDIFKALSSEDQRKTVSKSFLSTEVLSNVSNVKAKPTAKIKRPRATTEPKPRKSPKVSKPREPKAKRSDKWKADNDDDDESDAPSNLDSEAEDEEIAQIVRQSREKEKENAKGARAPPRDRSNGKSKAKKASGAKGTGEPKKLRGGVIGAPRALTKRDNIVFSDLDSSDKEEMEVDSD